MNTQQMLRLSELQRKDELTLDEEKELEQLEDMMYEDEEEAKYKCKGDNWR